MAGYTSEVGSRGTSAYRSARRLLAWGARINELKAEGYVFETKQRHGDYIYKLVKRPAAKQLTLV